MLKNSKTTKKKMRYINLGLVESEFLLPIWEYSQIIPLGCTTVFAYSPKDTIINVGGTDRMDKRVIMENLPADIKFLRYRNQTSAIYILSPDMISFVMHYPDIDKFKSLNKAIKAIVFKVLKKHNIPLIQEGNDIYFIKNNIKKKFFGIMEKSFIDEWKSMIFTITLKFNSKLANKIYKFDDEKFTKKGDITDISKIVGGLCEIKPNINKDYYEE